jgi:hypothetical protein
VTRAGSPETRRIGGVVPADGDEAGVRDPLARHRRVEVLVGAIELGPSLARQGLQQAHVAEREQLGDVAVVAARSLDMRREPCDQRGAPQAAVAGVHAA